MCNKITRDNKLKKQKKIACMQNKYYYTIFFFNQTFQLISTTYQVWNLNLLFLFFFEIIIIQSHFQQ